MLSEEAKEIGAINTIKVEGNNLIGHNTDYYGFQSSLLTFIPHNKIKALIFGSGGASKAVAKALEDLNISYTIVSRNGNDSNINYSDLSDNIIAKHLLLINTTPLGTFPNIDECIDINYNAITEHHLCFDLVYNPEETEFMKKCSANGAKTKNGLEMLELQAEKSWEIWNR